MSLYKLGEHAVSLPAAGRYWIAPTAVVIGQVTIEEEVGIWFGAVIRGDNEPIRIGARSNIQENCVLHVDPGFPMVIEEECTIGHTAMLHGCHIGRGALIGIGAIVLNGARIGAGAMIGAGALIPEGKVIPPNSVVFGTPGKVAREVNADDRKRVDAGVADYMARWKRYAATFKPQT
jgi:carbonic anhydrase/acetyltransferase-like protein (isoleucine patch superfamily)